MSSSAVVIDLVTAKKIATSALIILCKGTNSPQAHKFIQSAKRHLDELISFEEINAFHITIYKVDGGIYSFSELPLPKDTSHPERMNILHLAMLLGHAKLYDMIIKNLTEENKRKLLSNPLRPQMHNKLPTQSGTVALPIDLAVIGGNKHIIDATFPYNRGNIAKLIRHFNHLSILAYKGDVLEIKRFKETGIKVRSTIPIFFALAGNNTESTLEALRDYGLSKLNFMELVDFFQKRKQFSMLPNQAVVKAFKLGLDKNIINRDNLIEFARLLQIQLSSYPHDFYSEKDDNYAITHPIVVLALLEQESEDDMRIRFNPKYLLWACYAKLDHAINLMTRKGLSKDAVVHDSGKTVQKLLEERQLRLSRRSCLSSTSARPANMRPKF